KMLIRHGLDLIKDNDTIHQVMQTTALSRSFLKKSIQKLHHCGKDNGIVPIISAKLQLFMMLLLIVIRLIIQVLIVYYICVMFQDGIWLFDYVSYGFCVLFQNGCVRHNINNSFFFMTDRMF